MPAYEYKRLDLDLGDLRELNRYASVGWRVVSVVAQTQYTSFPIPVGVGIRPLRETYVLLERPRRAKRAAQAV